MKYNVNVKSTHFFDLSTIIDSNHALIFILKISSSIYYFSLKYPISDETTILNASSHPSAVTRFTNVDIKNRSNETEVLKRIWKIPRRVPVAT